MDKTTDKLSVRGVALLSDDELLEMVIGEGTERYDARELAGRIVASAGGVGGLSKLGFSRLRMVEGMGSRRAARIAAAIELGRRASMSEAAQRRRVVDERDVEELFRPRLEALGHEECWVVYLSSSNDIIEQMRVSQGGVQGTVVDRRLVVKRALELLATRMIMVHNHPSGTAHPSDDDVRLTDDMAAAAALFDIRLLDHIIIARDGVFGFRRAGLLPEEQAVR